MSEQKHRECEKVRSRIYTLKMSDDYISERNKRCHRYNDEIYIPPNEQCENNATRTKKKHGNGWKHKKYSQTRSFVHTMLCSYG